MAAIERFIQDTLSKEGQRMLEKQTAEITMKIGRRSGNLLSGRNITVSDSMLTLVHPDYERFLDMKVLGGKKRKRTKIHNRFTYGAYERIADRLMNGYKDYLAEIAKQQG